MEGGGLGGFQDGCCRYGMGKLYGVGREDHGSNGLRLLKRQGGLGHKAGKPELR